MGKYIKRKHRKRELTDIQKFRRRTRGIRTGCIIYKCDSIKPRHYRLFRTNDGKYVTAHRWIYEYTHKTKIPAGKIVCHKCDRPDCVNPDHLFIGTVQDNNRDKHEKGRDSRGNHHPTSVLTCQKVRNIREKYRNKQASQYQLAKQYGVSQTAIMKAITRQTWKHVK